MHSSSFMFSLLVTFCYGASVCICSFNTSWDDYAVQFLLNTVAILLAVVFYTSGVTHFWESCMEKNKCPKLRVQSFDEMRYFPFRDI